MRSAMTFLFSKSSSPSCFGAFLPYYSIPNVYKEPFYTERAKAEISAIEAYGWNVVLLNGERGREGELDVFLSRVEGKSSRHPSGIKKKIYPGKKFDTNQRARRRENMNPTEFLGWVSVPEDGFKGKEIRPVDSVYMGELSERLESLPDNFLKKHGKSKAVEEFLKLCREFLDGINRIGELYQRKEPQKVIRLRYASK